MSNYEHTRWEHSSSTHLSLGNFSVYICLSLDSFPQKTVWIKGLKHESDNQHHHHQTNRTLDAHTVLPLIPVAVSHW